MSIAATFTAKSSGACFAFAGIGIIIPGNVEVLPDLAPCPLARPLEADHQQQKHSIASERYVIGM